MTTLSTDEDLLHAVQTGLELRVFNFGDALKYILEDDRHRTRSAVINEIEARIALHLATTSTHLSPTNPHTGEYRGGQGYI